MLQTSCSDVRSVGLNGDPARRYNTVFARRVGCAGGLDVPAGD